MTDILATGTALGDVAAERQRQLSVEGWTDQHDDEHDGGELAGAASAYALYAANELHPHSQGDGNYGEACPEVWPFNPNWWKPVDPRTALVKAGALILAEIERIDRDAAKTQIEIVSLDWAQAPEWADKYGRAGDCGSKVWFSDTRYRYESSGAEYAISSGIHKAGTYALAEITLIATRPASQ
ncbi:hypothetical protein [Pseudomonas sp.]|uniref:hypothetical protein n=1 Tax=Pseudomonas sp. TaxID=306 RepID=UPI003FD8E1FE